MSDNLIGNDHVSSLIDPLILEIYLNTNNYKDRLLITDLKKRAHIVRLQELEESSFFVKAEEVEDIIVTKFKKDLIEFESISESSLPNNVTSIYFIDMMLREFKSLRYFRIHVSNSTNYTRKVADQIIFDYRIMHTKVDLATKCKPEFLRKVEKIFSTIGVYREELFHDKPYFEITAKDIFTKLFEFQSQFSQEDEEFLDVVYLLSIFGMKLEKDNSNMLIVMKK